jgi:hypothetical protein
MEGQDQTEQQQQINQVLDKLKTQLRDTERKSRINQDTLQDEYRNLRKDNIKNGCKYYLSAIAKWALIVLLVASFIGSSVTPIILWVLQLKHIIPKKAFIPKIGFPGSIAFVSIFALIIFGIITYNALNKLDDNIDTSEVTDFDKNDLRHMKVALGDVDKILRGESVAVEPVKDTSPSI